MNQASILSTRITTDADMIELTEWTLVKTTILKFFTYLKMTLSVISLCNAMTYY